MLSALGRAGDGSFLDGVECVSVGLGWSGAVAVGCWSVSLPTHLTRDPHTCHDPLCLCPRVSKPCLLSVLSCFCLASVLCLSCLVLRPSLSVGVCLPFFSLYFVVTIYLIFPISIDFSNLNNGALSFKNPKVGQEDKSQTTVQETFKLKKLVKS